MNYRWYYETPSGFSDMIMYSDGEYLTGLCFAGSKDETKHKFDSKEDDNHRTGKNEQKDGTKETIKEEQILIFQETIRWLNLYFSGKEPDFTPKYRVPGATEFRTKIIDEMNQIPYGETITYGEIGKNIAKKLGKDKMSAQAVGGAVGWNPICILIPCHRVMGAQGKLTGYGGGLENKIALLALEKRGRKMALRKKIKDKIKTLSPDYCKRADEIICQKVISLPEYEKADVVFCYVGTEREIDTRPILTHVLESGKRLCVPKCTSFGIMEALEIQDLNQLHPGAYGILEPDESCRVIRPEEISFACVPCLTCSTDGKRLGYGGGFYDRYLPKLDCKKAVLCRKELMVEKIPIDEFDIKVDYVVTDC